MAEKKTGSSFWPSWLLAFGRKPKVSEPSKGPEGDISPSQEKTHALELDNKLEKKKKEKKNDCPTKFLTISFAVLTVITAIVAVSLIAVSTVSAIATSVLDTQDTSGRLVALIVLVVTAAVTIAVIVYAQLAVWTDKLRPIFVATIVLIVLATLQTIVAGASVRVTQKDQVHITQGLADSFQLVKQHSPRHVKMWATMQSSLKCCGLYTPYDYRAQNTPAYMPPDVPISCCPSYDPDRSDLVQEKEREICKAKNEYYSTGCSGPVLEVIEDSSLWAFTVAVFLIVLEFISAIFGAGLVQKKKKDAAKKGVSELKEDPEANEK